MTYSDYYEKCYIIHKKVDLPKIKPYVVEYQWLLSEMRKKRSSKLPKGVMPDTFGPRVVL